jgi:hypothetical protein
VSSRSLFMSRPSTPLKTASFVIPALATATMLSRPSSSASTPPLHRLPTTTANPSRPRRPRALLLMPSGQQVYWQGYPAPLWRQRALLLLLTFKVLEDTLSSFDLWTERCLYGATHCSSRPTIAYRVIMLGGCQGTRNVSNSSDEKVASAVGELDIIYY